MTDERLEDASGQETEEQRERYRELLEELRTTIPGISVLLGFLLTAPFSQRFPTLDLLGKRAYAAALLASALAIITLLTPAAFHRLSPPGERATRLVASIRLQIAGMFLFLAAITIAVFVVTRLAFKDTAVGVVMGLVVAAVGLVLWYVMPISARDRD
jgi:hypothetical protein